MVIYSINYYHVFSSTEEIAKKIKGHFDMEPEVKKCIKRMMRLHPDLEKPIQDKW